MSESHAHSVLNDLLGPDPARRAEVLHRLRGSPDALAALRPHLDARLTDDPADRFAPALLIRELYGDTKTLLRLAVDALRSAAPDDEVREAVLELPTLGVPGLLVECAFARTALFSTIFERSPRWASRLLISAGRPGILTLRLFVAELPDPLLHQVAAVIADEALTSPHDLTPLAVPLAAVRLRPLARLEVGVARWRLTWRIDPEWVDWLCGSISWSLTGLLADVLVEMLPVCPALDPLVPQLFDARVTERRQKGWIAPLVRRLLALGGRGVRLLVTVDPHYNLGYAQFRAEVLTDAAESPSLSAAFLPLALQVIQNPILTYGESAIDALRAACRVVATVGQPAKPVAADLIGLLATTEEFAPALGDALVACAAGDAQLGAILLDRLLQYGSDVANARIANDGQAIRRLEAMLSALFRLKASWLPRVLDDPPTSVVLRLVTEFVLAALTDDERERALEVAARRLADERPDVREEAAEWLRMLEPDPARRWPWLVAATTLPRATPEAIALLAELGEVKEPVSAELTFHLADANPAIAANATAAQESLNSAAG